VASLAERCLSSVSLDLMKRAAVIIYLIGVAALITSAFADSRKPYSLPMPYAPFPEYPEEARAKRWTGTGLFLVKADTNAGVVNGVTTIRSTGHSILDKAAEKTLYHWKFPAGNRRRGYHHSSHVHNKRR
jgi:TonB family protein